MDNFDVIDQTREIVAISDDLDRSIGIVVCIPSFRRPQHLRLTLDSLADQHTDRRFAVVIVENDSEKCEGVAVAQDVLAGGRVAGLCLIEPRQGNCYAINAAFETALATFDAASYFLMIDDDEIAAPDWLERMVAAAERTRADLIGGPVKPHFDDAGKRSLRRHPAFRPAYDVSGPVLMIYGCGNCLITRRVFDTLSDPVFDLRFNFLGGGDTDFFMRCRKAGMTFHWEEHALVTETVPNSRTRPCWLALRALRIGAINYRIEAKTARTLASRARLLAKILLLFPLSIWRGIRLVGTEHRALIALHPLLVAAGGALAALGIEPQPYKASKMKS